MSSIPRLASHYCDKLESILVKRMDRPDLPLLTLTELNKIIWGIQKKKLTIIGARTSNGKSAMALNIAYDIASQNHSTLFLSLEMPVEDMLERIFCYNQKIENKDLMRGKFGLYKQQWKDFKESIKNMPLVLSDMIGRTTKEITEFLESVEPKPELIILDHIQEIQKIDTDKKDTIDKYLYHMRGLAIRHNFALVICSQINRLSQDEKNKEPQLHHLKGSGAIEEMADIIMLLHWPYFYGQNPNINLFRLYIGKNRNGATGHINLKYLPQFSRFEDFMELENQFRQGR